MTVRRYEIKEAFSYEAYMADGCVSGEFSPGVTGDDLTDEQALYLEQHAVPVGLAVVVDDSAPPAPPTPPVPPVSAPKPEPEAPAPAPTDTQEKAQ